MRARSPSSISSSDCVRGGFTLLDVQFVTDHLRQFGAVEIPRAEFHAHLTEALKRSGRFHPDADVRAG